MKIRSLAVVALLSLGLGMTACDIQPSGEQIIKQQQDQATLQGAQAVGFPNIVTYTEKRQLKAILELRDKAITTTTYIVDLNGNLHKVCDSIGYGIPYATQYTNPQQVDSYHGAVISQADPNGLYSPAVADGTWVLCLSPGSSKTLPVYIEPRVVVSPFALHLSKMSRHRPGSGHHHGHRIGMRGHRSGGHRSGGHRSGGHRGHRIH